VLAVAHETCDSIVLLPCRSYKERFRATGTGKIRYNKPGDLMTPRGPTCLAGSLVWLQNRFDSPRVSVQATDTSGG
jgi:hypothetical protein